MIKMFGYLQAWGCSDMSPHVSYTDLYLRLAKFDFEVEVLHQGDLTKAPKGKLPYIIDTDGTIVSDTQLIEEYLVKRYGDRLDAHLTKEQRAVATITKRMFSEGWYWYVVQTRYRRDEDFAIYDPLWVTFLAWLPVEQRREPVRIFRERLLSQFWFHGQGRNSEAEVEQMCASVTDALSDMLGDQKYIFGDKPTSIDSVTYANLAHLVLTPFPGPMVDYVLSKKNLMAYVNRIFDEHYPHLRKSRADAEKYRAEAKKQRKPYGPDSDRMIEELFKGRPKREAIPA